MPSLESEVLGHVRKYLDGQTTLREFEDWFLPAIWHLDPDEDSAAATLACRIELYLAEFTNGHLAEDHLKVELNLLCLQQLGLVVDSRTGPLEARMPMDRSCSANRLFRAPPQYLAPQHKT